VLGSNPAGRASILRLGPLGERRLSTRAVQLAALSIAWSVAICVHAAQPINGAAAQATAETKTLVGADAKRQSPLQVVDSGDSGATSLGAASSSSDPANFEGIWQPDYSAPKVQSAIGTSGALSTIDGSAPPYTADAANIFWHRVLMEQRGTPVANSASLYLPGIPVAGLALYLAPMDIIQTHEDLDILFEGGFAWSIHLNRGHPEKLSPTYQGDSVGHWEGATLVVDSTGFNTKTWLDPVGSPHSAALRFITRITKIDAGRKLEFVTTFDDPKMYSTPFTTHVTASWRPDLRIQEVEIENMRPENNSNLVYE